MISKSNPLFVKADLLAKEIYKLTQNFPRHELYGLTSQLRRAALSVILNIVEGFARQSPAEFRRFLLISFGSLQETNYVLEFACGQGYLSTEEFTRLVGILNEVSKITWSILHTDKGNN